MNMSVETAFRRSIETVIDFINTRVDTSKTHVFFRTFAPIHFRFFQFTFCSLTLFVIKNLYELIIEF